jgi:hypothetical protein
MSLTFTRISSVLIYRNCVGDRRRGKTIRLDMRHPSVGRLQPAGPGGVALVTQAGTGGARRTRIDNSSGARGYRRPSLLSSNSPTSRALVMHCIPIEVSRLALGGCIPATPERSDS